MANYKNNQSPSNQTYNYINDDFSGERDLNSKEELVAYRGQSSHRIWLNDLTERYEDHWHNALEIIVPVENYYDAEINGIKTRIGEGEIFIIPPQAIHTLSAPETGSRFIYIMDMEGICHLRGYSGISAILSQPLLITKETYPIIYDDIYNILVQMRNEYYRNSPYSELTIQSLMLNLLVCIGDNHNYSAEMFSNVRSSKHKEYVERFNELLEYINEHYMEELRLEDMAYMIGFSKYHFSRLFKQYTDYTFCDYLTYRRIKVATEYLANPDYSITDAAMSAGFQSISTFNRLFKQNMGCTPREFRNKRTGAPNYIIN